MEQNKMNDFYVAIAPSRSPLPADIVSSLDTYENAIKDIKEIKRNIDDYAGIFINRDDIWYRIWGKTPKGFYQVSSSPYDFLNSYESEWK